MKVGTDAFIFIKVEIVDGVKDLCSLSLSG